MIEKQPQLRETLQQILLSNLPLLIERPQMLCGPLVCAESYLLAFDHISEGLCGSSFYRKFLFESGFGSQTFTSTFQSHHSCSASLVALQADANSDISTDQLESPYSAKLAIHLRHFYDYLSKEENSRSPVKN